MYCMPEGECVIPATYTWDEKHDDDAKKDKSYHGDQLSGGWCWLLKAVIVSHRGVWQLLLEAQTSIWNFPLQCLISNQVSPVQPDIRNLENPNLVPFSLSLVLSESTIKNFCYIAPTDICILENPNFLPIPLIFHQTCFPVKFTRNRINDQDQGSRTYTICGPLCLFACLFVCLFLISLPLALSDCYIYHPWAVAAINNIYVGQL